jgi:hypothetical protein
MSDENSDMAPAEPLIEYVLKVLAAIVVAAPAPSVVLTSCIPRSSQD